MTYRPYNGPDYTNPDHQGYFNRLLKQNDDTCEDCGNEMVHQNGCKHCPVCGNSKCS